jgi:histidinol phosphatase-like PHP family hydrolase
MQILNFPDEDHHMHTFNFSDGADTIDGMVEYAGEIGLKVITITDHSQAILDFYRKKEGIMMPLSPRWIAKDYTTPYDNGVEVRFGLEADLIDETGRICDWVGNREYTNPEERLILSAHKDAYQGDPRKVTQGLIKAIEKHHKRIIAIGHPCLITNFSDYMDIRELCKAANDYGVPLEFNAKNFARKKINTDLTQLDRLFEHADQVMVNSDAHFKDALNTRMAAFKYLEDKGLFILE